MLIDTHCHLNDEELYCDIKTHINEAINKGVKKIIVVGWDKTSSIEAIKIASIYEECYASIGLHPENIEDENDLSWIYDLAKNDKVIAIGEIGLDYHWKDDNKDEQKRVFLEQIKIAKELDLPIIVHTRDATLDTYNTIFMSEYNKGVIHCYTGSFEMANKFIGLGYYLGIGGVLTFKNANICEVVARLGISKIVSETDSPYLAPVPYRGKINTPKYIYEIVNKISEVTNISFEEVEKQIEANVYEIFKI